MPGRTILAIVAHPDDAELTCAGAIARWVRDGDEAVLVVATDGALGGKEVDAEPQAVVRDRHMEQEEAASVIGFARVDFLGLHDGELENARTLRELLVRRVRELRPHVVVVMDPLTVIYRDSYVNHQDHRALGMATLDALYPEASNAGYYPEHIRHGLTPHKVPELLLAQTESPNYWVDVTDTLDIRFDALRRHRSQIGLWPDNGEEVIAEQRAYASVVGLEHGMRYAEAYRRVVVNPLA